MAKYTDAQKDQFCEQAGKVGVPAAIAALGFPTTHTAYAWLEQRSIVVPKSPLMAMAAELKHFYGATEKLALLQVVLDQSYDLLVNGEPTDAETVVADPQTGEVKVAFIRKPLGPNGLRAVSGTVKATVEAMELLEGRVTGRVEHLSADATDLELRTLIQEQNARALEEERRARLGV